MELKEDCHHVMRWEMQVPWEPVGVGTWPQRLLLSLVFAESSRGRNGQSREQKGRSCPGRVPAGLWRVRGGRLGHHNIGVRGAPCPVSLVCGLAGLCDLSWQGRWHLVPWAPGRWTPWGVHVSALGPALRDRFGPVSLPLSSHPHKTCLFVAYLGALSSNRRVWQPNRVLTVTWPLSSELTFSVAGEHFTGGWASCTLGCKAA